MFNSKKSGVFGLLRGWDTKNTIRKLQTAKHDIPPSRAGRLNEAQNFGTNPGQLGMFSYVPQHVPGPLPLVVVLHGCGQTAAGYDHGAGWSMLADRYGFAVLLPEQQRSNNPNGCFNWFQPGDTQRDGGEAASIHQMVEYMIRDSGVDSSRVFVTGLSAGGAMTSVMLACYPDVFAAGAIIAGLPYGAAANVQQALKSMYQSPPRTARHWGDLVRAAAPPPVKSWPRVSVWHGNADQTVVPANAIETIKQWTNVHGLAAEPSKLDSVQGHSRQVWLNDAGDEIVESYSIPLMAHGTPLATGDAAFQCGAAGPFLLDVGISSSFHIAQFFGIIGDVIPAAKFAAPKAASRPLRPAAEPLNSARTNDEANSKPGSAIDISAVISAALAKAGLLRR